MTDPRLDTQWATQARRAVDGRTFAYVGSDTDHAVRLRAVGAEVVATVEVTLESEERARDALDAPTLGLVAPTRSSGVLQASAFAATVTDNADVVNTFLHRHDPHAEAVLVSPLALPVTALGKVRAAWAPDVDVAQPLEEKRAGAAPVDAGRWIPSLSVPEQPTRAWWKAITSRFGVSRVVVQSLGLNGGGERVWPCDSFDDLFAVVARAGPSRVSPYVDGVSMNAMACIGVDGAVLTLPPTRQLIADVEGRRVYAGNIATGLSGAACDSIRDDVRAIADGLVERGYVGPFGVDGIVDAAGGCHFHDFNARINGVVHLFEAHVPAMACLMTVPGWLTHGAVDGSERELTDLVGGRPLARWLLAQMVGESGGVARVSTGRYRWIRRHAEFVESVDALDAVAPGTVVVRALLHGQRDVRRGDLVSLAHVWMDAADADEVLEEHGLDAMRVVRDALAGAAAHG